MLVKVRDRRKPLRIKPWFTRSQVRGEMTGPYWLLKRDDPYIWFGAKDGHVFTGNVIPGGEVPEAEFLQPKRRRSQRRVEAASPFGVTPERVLTRHGAFAGKGKSYKMTAYYHPLNLAKYVVAGWDPYGRCWVVEG